MDPKLVEFSVIKQKIIKTDEVLQMYMENNKKLKKTQQAYKDLKTKYEEANSGLNRFQLESDRSTFSLQHITSKHNKLESEYKHLEQQNKMLEQKYCKHLIDSQTAILDLENELRMMKELNESVELLSSSPKKKLASKDDESPKKIKELEEALKKFKQNEARFKQENDKLLLERNELVADMKKMRNEHSNNVHVSQEERKKLAIELNGLKSQIASKQTQYNDVLLAKDKEISKLNAEVLALRGLKEQLKFLKEENKKLNKNIRCNDIASQKEKLRPSRAVQTQTTQNIKSVLEENKLLKTEIKMYKCQKLKCQSTQTESNEECESLEEIFKAMAMLPRMLSPMLDEPSNARTTQLPQSEEKYSTSKDYTKEKSESAVLDDKSIFRSLVPLPFVMKEECFNNQSEKMNEYFLLSKEMKEHFEYISETSTNHESKADILIFEENTRKTSATSSLKTENVIVRDGFEVVQEESFSANEIEGRQSAKENPQLEAKTTLLTVDNQNQDLSVSLTDSKENLCLFKASEKESPSFRKQSPIEEGSIIAHSQLYQGIVPSCGSLVGEFQNQPLMNNLKVQENPHLENESTPSKANDQQNFGVALQFKDNKENIPLFDASQCDSQKIENQPSIDYVNLKENPQLSSADNCLCNRLGLFEHNEGNIPLLEGPVGESHEHKNQLSMNVIRVKENALLEAESTLSIANNQKHGIFMPHMENKENFLFDTSQGAYQEIENQSSIDDIKEDPQLDSKSTVSTTHNLLYPRFSLLSLDHEENLFKDPIGDSQKIKNQTSINVPSVKENSQLENEIALSTADNQNHGIFLPPIDNKENLPLFEAQEGESHELENTQSKTEHNVREDSEPVASCSSGKKSKTPQRRKYRLSSKVSDSATLRFKRHPPTRKQIYRKEMRMRKCRRVDSVLRALQVLKRSKINFTISNESTLPVHWKDSNWLDRFSGGPANSGQPLRRMRVKNPVSSSRTNTKQSTRKLSCASKACKSTCMSLESRCGKANLLGFFNVKQEAVSPLGEPLDKKPDNPLKWLNESLPSDKTMETLLEKLAVLVSEKLKNDKHSKRKRTVSPPSRDSEFCSETETELERLIEEPGYDVLERNKMLLKRAKYEHGRDSTSLTSLEMSDMKNSVVTPPFADSHLKTEHLELATTHPTCSNLQSPLNSDRKHSLPPVVSKTALRAVWNEPALKEEPSEVTAEISREVFENADSCDSYRLPICPSLLSPLSSCAADSPKIRHINLTPKKEDSEINSKTPEKKKLASICKFEEKSEILSPIRKIDDLRKSHSPVCKTHLDVENRVLHPYEIKRENLRVGIKTEVNQMDNVIENTSATVETSDSGLLKVLEKRDLEKLGCSGIEGLYTDKSPKKPNLDPILQPEILITLQTANNFPGVEHHKHLSANLSGGLENTSPPASTTHRSFQLLKSSNLRQYSNRSKNRKSSGNSKEYYSVSSLPVFANQIPPSQFVCNELLTPKVELEVGPPDEKTTIEEDFLLPLISLGKTDFLSVSLEDVQIQEMNPSSPTRDTFNESRNMSVELNNESSCISEFLANETQITKEIESFMTKFGIDRSFTQESTLQNEKTSSNIFETAEENIETVSIKISASDILDIIPRSEEVPSSYEKHKVPSCPQSPELQPAPADFVPKVIPLERNSAVNSPINNTPIANTPITNNPITGTPINDTPITYTPMFDSPQTDTPSSQKVLSKYEKEEEKEVPSCPRSPELQPAPADFVPKVIPLERNSAVNSPISDTPIANTPITDIPINYTPITYTPMSDSPKTNTPSSQKVLSKYEKEEEKELPSCPRSPELQPAPKNVLPKVIPLERNVLMDTPINLTPITDSPITDTLFTDIPITYIPITTTPITDSSVTDILIIDIPITYDSMTDTSVTETITGTPRTFTLITSTPITTITSTDTLVTESPITNTLIRDTPTNDAPTTDTSITDTHTATHSLITDIPISDTRVTKRNIKEGASGYTTVTKGYSKVTQRRSKRLSKAIISSSSEMESEDDVCERLKESPTKVLNFDNTGREQIKRKRGRPRIFPPKEIITGPEKVVRKRGRPRKYPVQEMSADELESKRNCVESVNDSVESNGEKTDVDDGEEGQKLTSCVSQPSENCVADAEEGQKFTKCDSRPLKHCVADVEEGQKLTSCIPQPSGNCSSASPKKVVKPKQKISKLKSNVLRQMKLKQKMFQSDKHGSSNRCNIDCDVERNDAMEANVEFENNRLCAESNNQHGEAANNIDEKMFQSNKPGNIFCSNNGCDVKTNDITEANLEIRDNRSSVEFDISKREKLARDPDKRITVVQDIIIKAGHKPNESNGLNFEASSSQNCGDKIPKKSRRTKKNCDILSQIMGDMDKGRPKILQKKIVTPKKILPQGLDDKQWRKGILEIAEITHNKDIEVKENSTFLGHDAKMDSGILNKGIEMSGKVQILLQKLKKISNEDEIPDHVLIEFKKLQVDIIVDVIIHQVAKDFKDKPDTKHFPAPLMTKTQRIYLALMLKLEQKKVEQLIDTFLVRAKHYILKRGCGLKAAIPLTRLIIGVCRIRADIHTMRMFCCEAFFFIGDLAVPVLFTVLTSWIDVIPMEADVKNYPMAKVLVQLVHLKTCNKPGYNLFALRCLLSQFYGYPKERSNCDTLFEEVFHEFLRNPSPSSDFAIRLFCRNKDTKWVYKKINEFFKPLIYKIPTENENFKATTILLLGKISRQFRLKEEHDRDCLVELNRFFTGLLEDNVTELVKRSVSLTIDRLPKEKIKIPKEKKQSDSKVAVNEKSQVVRKNITRFLPNSNRGYQNNKKGKQGVPERNWTSKKKAPPKKTSTEVSTGQ